MNHLLITVPGTPIAQPRPRARNAGEHARVYSPKSHKVYEWREKIKKAARLNRPVRPFEDPIQVDLTFVFPRPQRLMRKKDHDGRMWHTSKPDRDNLDKAVLDCLSEDGWWKDDSQVVLGTMTKLYAAKDEEPCVEIALAPIVGHPSRVDAYRCTIDEARAGRPPGYDLRTETIIISAVVAGVLRKQLDEMRKAGDAMADACRDVPADLLRVRKAVTAWRKLRERRES